MGEGGADQVAQSVLHCEAVGGHTVPVHHQTRGAGVGGAGAPKWCGAVGVGAGRGGARVDQKHTGILAHVNTCTHTHSRKRVRVHVRVRICTHAHKLAHTPTHTSPQARRRYACAPKIAALKPHTNDGTEAFRHGRTHTLPSMSESV